MTDFNTEQKKAIECNTNCVVSAGAGSGKTEVLSERFMRLVKEGNAHCDEILTITFTRKATSEMKSRIHGRLLKEKLNEELRRFSSACISTVDGFCSSIVKSDCRRYGITEDFSTFDETDLHDFAAKLADRFLNSRYNDETVKYLIGTFGCENTTEMLTKMAEQEFDFVRPTDPQENARAICSFNRQMLAETKERLLKGCNEFIEALEIYENEKNNVDTVKQIADCAVNNDYSAMKNLKINGRLGNSEAKNLVRELRAGFEEPQKQFEILCKASENEDRIHKLCQLVSEYEKEITEQKRRMNCLTFSDVMKLAIDILETNKILRSNYKRKFKYIMIDEFQDNNDDYRKLLYLLAEQIGKEADGIPAKNDLAPDKIFLVGDEKQSIYRFRGADVSVFKKLCSEIGQTIELSINYRSQKPLVDNFNKLFSVVMSNGRQSFEADFKSLGAKEENSDENRIDSKILFHNFLQSQDKDNYSYECATPTQSEAYGIAQLIDRMIHSNDFMIEKNGEKTVPEPGDIAILLRSASRQSDYEKALRLKGISYSITEARSLFSEALANDFYNVLQLCVYPYDRTSLIAFLKSPFCRLTDREILSLDLDNLPDEYQGILDKVKTKLKTSTLTQTLDFIYYDMGYRNFLISNPANQVYCEHYDYLYALFSKYEISGKGLSEALDYIRPMLGKAGKMMELKTYREENDGVKIMTIHKSKGLGFPIVIVAGMQSEKNRTSTEAKSCRVGETLFFNCVENEKGRLVNPYTFIYQDLEAQMENAELKRLLYVAATRAKCHLVFSSCEPKKNSMAQMLIDAAGFDYETQKSKNIDMDGIPFDFADIKETLSRTRLNEKTLSKNAEWYENVKKTHYNWEPQTAAVTSLGKEQADTSCEKLQVLESDEIIIKYNIQTDFGTLVHSYIENSICGKSSKPVFKVPINLTESEENRIYEDARLLADGFLKGSLFNSIKEYSLYPEREFYMKKDDVILNGKIDLLALSEKEAVVIDFKTDVIRDEKQHIGQLTCYADAVSSVYPEKIVKCFVVFLRDADNPVRIK